MVRIKYVDDETSDFLRLAHGATTVQAVFLFAHFILFVPNITYK